jgi:hypothetical protein
MSKGDENIRRLFSNRNGRIGAITLRRDPEFRHADEGRRPGKRSAVLMLVWVPACAGMTLGEHSALAGAQFNV